MSTKAKKKNSVPANIVWFEIPADKPARAKAFYSKLFGWKIKAFPGMKNYSHIDTGGGQETVDGGLRPRSQAGEGILNYIWVASVDKHMVKVKKLGGKVCMPKTEVPGMGWFAICQDPEKNTFAIWERIPPKK